MTMSTTKEQDALIKELGADDAARVALIDRAEAMPPAEREAYYVGVRDAVEAECRRLAYNARYYIGGLARAVSEGSPLNAGSRSVTLGYARDIQREESERYKRATLTKHALAVLTGRVRPEHAMRGGLLNVDGELVAQPRDPAIARAVDLRT
jgi:hypothetical protein